MKEINKEEFIREIAKRSHFTIGDIRNIWAVIEEIFADAIRERIPLNLRGFGKMYFSEIKSRGGSYGKDGVERKKNPNTERLSFRFSRNFKNLLK